MTQFKIILMGSGRSGSNRLLNMFDYSRDTICRSEVTGVRGSDLGFLPGRRFFDDMTDEVRSTVAHGIARAPGRRSSRDRFDRTDKAFFSPLARPWLKLAARHSLRVAATRVGVMTSPHEWNVPRLCLRGAALDRAVLVMKLNGWQPWLDVMRSDGQPLKLIHNIRKPQEFLTSWYNRWAPRSDQATFQSAFSDMTPILAHFGRGQDDVTRLSDLSHDSLLEIELWRWRFLNERLYSDFSGTPDYQLITYHEIDADPVKAAQGLYDFVGLTVTPQTKASIGQMTNKMFTQKHTRSLDPVVCDRLVDQVLAGSPLHQVPGLIQTSTTS